MSISAGWSSYRVYRRPRGALSWEQAVISLQALLGVAVVVGGRTALETQGYAHFLQQEQKEVHLYGGAPPPSWLFKLPLLTAFAFHRTTRLFPDDHPERGLTMLGGSEKDHAARAALRA